MRFNRSGSQPLGFLVSVVAAGLLAGCAGQSMLTPPPANFDSTDTLARLGANEPDVSPPAKCNGQKTTEFYAEMAKEVMKTGGGSLCVPAFKGWGGALQYPRTDGSAKYTVKLVSSVSAYKGALLPPRGSKKPMLYLQIGFSGPPGFNPTLPKGAPLVSSHFAPKKSYTVELFEYYYALGWSEEASCYQVAETSKNGGALVDVGAVFQNVTFRESNGAIEIFAGALVSNKC